MHPHAQPFAFHTAETTWVAPHRRSNSPSHRGRTVPVRGDSREFAHRRFRPEGESQVNDR
jgi:hypothetical protein